MEKISDATGTTESIGCNLAAKIKTGDVITIEGEIGAGKTTFIKGVLHGFGYTGNVN